MAAIPPDAPFLRIEKNGDVLVDVHVVPNAAKTQPVGLHGEPGQLALRLRLQAPPVDGKANQALIKWLAHRLGGSQKCHHAGAWRNIKAQAIAGERRRGKPSYLGRPGGSHPVILKFHPGRPGR